MSATQLQPQLSQSKLLFPQVTDFDGTMADGEEMVLRIDFQMLNTVVRSFGKEIPYDLGRFCELYGGKSFAQILDLSLPTMQIQPLDSKVSAQLVSEEQDKVIEAIKKGNLKPCPNVVEVIKGMINEGRWVGISSSSTRPRLEAAIEALGLSDEFPSSKIVSGQTDFDPPRPKPFADCFLKSTEDALSEFKGKQMLYGVEDSVGGNKGANAAKKALQARGIIMHPIWYTGALSPELKEKWRPEIVRAGTQFELNDWLDFPTLYGLIEDGHWGKARTDFGIKT